MSSHCPHLGMKDSWDQVLLTAHPDHRCYVTREPERIGGHYQVSTCLTPGYRKCPRLVSHAPAVSVVPPPRAPAPLPHKRATAPRYADLQPAPRVPRRAIKPFEIVIAGLILSAVVAALSLGYAVSHHFREPDTDVVAVVQAATPERTLVPTATATATATETAAPTPTVATPVPTPDLTPTLAVATAEPRPPAVSPPTRLVIDKIDLDIPVKPVGPKQMSEGGRTRIVWGDVPNAGGFHNTSAYPGNGGNTVINGHRDVAGSVFRNLDRVEVGDEIVVYVGQDAYRYEVTEILIVPETFATAAQRAENTVLISAYPEERLTLVTCTPVGLATHRLLVIARPPELVVPEMPIAGDDP